MDRVGSADGLDNDCCTRRVTIRSDSMWAVGEVKPPGHGFHFSVAIGRNTVDDFDRGEGG